MSLNAAALKLMQEKGLTLDDVVEIAAAMESRSKAAERQSRYRKRKAERDVTGDVTPPLNESNSNPPDLDCSNEQSPPLAVRVVEAWNDGPGKNGARQARALDQSRKRSLEQRRKEHGEAAIFEAIANLGQSRFHCGENDRGWSANIGWMLKSPENFLKMLELRPAANDRKPAAPLTAEEAERVAAFHASRGDHDKAERVRREATGPPRSLGQLAGSIVARAEHGQA